PRNPPAVAPGRAAPAPPRRDRELDRADLLQLGLGRRTPGELDARLPDRDALPLVRQREVALVPPPDVPTACIDQLELEVVRPGLTAEVEREGEVVGERERERLSDDHEPATRVELEPDVHRHAATAGLRRHPEVRALGRRRRPTGELLEVVEDRRLGVRAGDGGDPDDESERDDGPRHSFPPPAMMPVMYQRWSATKTTT